MSILLRLITINLLKIAEGIKKEGFLRGTDIANLLKNADLNNKVATLGTKPDLKAEQDRIKKLEEFDSS